MQYETKFLEEHKRNEAGGGTQAGPAQRQHTKNATNRSRILFASYLVLFGKHIYFAQLWT